MKEEKAYIMATIKIINNIYKAETFKMTSS